MTMAIEDIQLEQMVSANKARSIEREKPVLRFTPPHAEAEIPEDGYEDCWEDAEYDDISIMQDKSYEERFDAAARLFGLIFRLAPATVFVLGAMYGLMDWAFAGFCSAPFLVWSVSKLLKKW